MELKENIKESWEYITDKFDDLIHWFKSIRHWFSYCFNKPHLKFIWEAIVAYPYDCSSIYKMEMKQMEDFKYYFSTANFITQDAYDRKIMELNRSINLLDIAMGNRETYHFTGELKFIKVEDKKSPSGKDLYKIDRSNHQYHCDVKVNIKNISRYVPNKKLHAFYMNHPHELYELKAMELYYKSKAYYSSDWWD